MKFIVLLFILTFIQTPLFAQSLVTSDSLDKKLISHFEVYKPELYRYSGLTFYGEAKSDFSDTQIANELKLYDEIKKSGLIIHPSNNVFALCHNLLIHTQETGKEFLQLLNHPYDDKQKLNLFLTEILFAGEFGEQIIVENLFSTDEKWREVSASFISENAIFDSSIPKIEEAISKIEDIDIKTYLINSLMYIGNPKSIDFVRQVIDTTTSEQIQEKGIFVYAELTGFGGLEYLSKIKPVGPKAKEEKESSIKWLRKETNSKNMYGTEVNNDLDFIMRFGDIKSPSMVWLDKEGYLEEKVAKKPKALSKDKKDKILNLLIDSKGFGLEAIKGQLFLSLEPSDIEKLLEIRRICYYSPNRFTQGRINTLGILIRYLKKK